MRILILGDSLPFPRPTKGQSLRATWPSLLKVRLPQCDSYLRAHPRSTIIDVIRELGFFTESLAEFDAIIVQTGIVDCAPRPYPHLVAKLFLICLSTPAYRKLDRFFSRRLLWLYRKPWVSERAFGEAVVRLVETAFQQNQRLTVLFIPIATPNRAITLSLPGIEAAAARYNTLLTAKVRYLAQKFDCRCVSPFAGANPLEITIDDGHHLSTHGHELIADALVEALDPPNAAPVNSTRL